MILVLGSGVAGLACALAAADVAAGASSTRATEVVIVTPGELSRGSLDASGEGGGNTALAQGGIAAALGPTDSSDAHARDTVAVGAALTLVEAAKALTSRGVVEVRGLLADGFPADRAADGTLELGLEAAHSQSRIVHSGGDRTGAALHAHLADRVLSLVDSGRIRLLERSRAQSLMTESGAVVGAVISDDEGRVMTMRADAVVMATGGFAGLYPRTSNHSGALGEGIVLAAHAGAVISDLEFVQFHPTVLGGTGFLISEAVRGAGATLLNAAGEQFMLGVHPDAELAPRDVVARSIHREMRRSGEASVWLDATGIERDRGPGALAKRFPRITEAILANGSDWTREPVRASPAAHYTMGGVATDLSGKTTVPGLFAAGEVAAIGVHGANRLASNSLLEGLVFGRRAALAAIDYIANSEWTMGSTLTNLVQAARQLPTSAAIVSRTSFESSSNLASPSAQTRTVVAEGLGIERDAAGLCEVRALLEHLPGVHNELAVMVAVAAEARTESRGAHQRIDYPETDPTLARRAAWMLSTSAIGTDLSLEHADVANRADLTNQADLTRSFAAC